MRSLTSEQQEDLLVKLLDDRGGVELAKCLLQRNDSSSTPGSPPSPNSLRPPPSQGAPDWCKCGKCRQMDNPVERVCCRNSPCTTTSDLFYDICLNRHVLSVGIINRSDFLEKIQNLLQRIIEKSLTDFTSCTNMGTWEEQIERSFLHA